MGGEAKVAQTEDFKTGMPARCPICKVYFATLEDLITHRKSETTKGG